ncbi:MAG: acyltransferase [Lentisphaeria bacterium]
MPPPKTSTRYLALDAMRFFAALAVMLFHYRLCYNESQEFSIFRYGYLGVNVFFMISGFVISFSADGKTWREFVASRFCRLYPAFWICCTISWLGLHVIFSRFLPPALTASPGDYLVNLSMVPRFVDVKMVDGVYWTLQVELIFYLYVFALLLFFKYSHFLKFLTAWILIAAANAVLQNGIIEKVFITEWAPYFVMGAIFYGAAKNRWDLFKVLLLCLAAASVGLRMVQLQKVVPMLSVLVPTLLVFLMLSLGRMKLNSNVLVAIGSVTYPLYLIHNCSGMVLFKLAKPASIPPALLIAAVSLTMIFTAYGIVVLVEKPFSKWIRKYVAAVLGVIPDRTVICQWIFRRQEKNILMAYRRIETEETSDSGNQP